jgi:ATP-dependent Zn protease
MTEETTKRRHEATHEAGHAVIGTILGLHVSRVGFNAKDGSSLIHFPATTKFVEADGNPCALIAVQPDIMIVVMMAGVAAERALLGSQLPHSLDADLGALKYCYPDFPDAQAEYTALLDPAAREAMRLAEAHLREIAAVAESLLEAGQLDGDGVASIIESVQAEQRST